MHGASSGCLAGLRTLAAPASAASVCEPQKGPIIPKPCLLLKSGGHNKDVSRRQPGAGSCVRNRRGFVPGAASAGRFVSSGAGMVTQGSVPSPAVLLRASPDSGQGHWFLPSLGEVLAADPACLSTALPGGRQGSPGLSGSAALCSVA